MKKIIKQAFDDTMAEIAPQLHDHGHVSDFFLRSLGFSCITIAFVFSVCVGKSFFDSFASIFVAVIGLVLIVMANHEHENSK